jgi:hypothetical protein
MQVGRGAGHAAARGRCPRNPTPRGPATSTRLQLYVILEVILEAFSRRVPSWLLGTARAIGRQPALTGGR